MKAILLTKEYFVHQYMRIAALVCFAFGTTSVHAQGLYKWIDSRGGIHYTNTPTNTTAKTVDDALPPASNFKSLAPPEPPKSAADTTNETEPTAQETSNEGASEQTQNAPAPPEEQPQASDQ